ncbi:MAG: DUF4031 domain-containing protein [Methylotenera sp.]|uniref:DUF4031 domain-containing protein n=1 Tax=Methylotenera sp. TaxID=2051956 RepID=UPI0024882E9F|nr:DUF4031 domain-containing protein [Methylotenera sp.]MDI1309728.1 DUF4031 domain-containing protein [Methylotenera sp.]
MAIYIDNVQIKWRGRKWCHMVADSIDELQSFAKALSLKPEWFQTDASYPHYDVTTETRIFALKLGAIEGERKDIIRCAKLLKFEQDQTRVATPPPFQEMLF